MAVHDQDLLQQLGQRAAERLRPEPEDTDLVALCEGELSAEAHAELLQRAEVDPELMRALRAYQPLDQAKRRRIAGRVVASLRENQQSAGWGKAEAPSAKQSLPRRSLPRKGRLRLWQIPALTAPLAAAAALAFWLMGPVQQGGSVDELPPYSLYVEGGIQVERGSTASDAAQMHALAPHGRLTLVARPDTVVGEQLTATLFAQVGATWKRVAVNPQVADAGAVRVVAPAKVLATAGVREPSRVCLLVARPQLVDGAAGLLDGSEMSGRGWQRFCVVVELRNGSGGMSHTPSPK